MKRSILTISLMTVVMAAFAINYPTYKPTTPTYGGGGSNGTGNTDNTGVTYGGYSTVATGGTTTYGEGAATGPARGPRRNAEFDHKFENGQWWVYLNGEWVVDGNYRPTDAGDQSDQSPIGTPWIMLLFAAMAAGVVAVRRRKAMAVVALLLVCGQGWAYEFVDGGTGNDAVRWANGETFTIVFVDNTESAQFQNAGGANGTIKVKNESSKVVTFTSETTWQRTNSNYDVFHWQTSTYNWTHGSQEWYKFSTKGKKTATNEFPIPDRTGYTTLTITLDGSGNSVFTWSGGSTPEPAPMGDHKIDGCDGCFLVEE